MMEFEPKLTLDLDSQGLKTSENDFYRIFPRVFGDRQIFG
jgi:hypothetical protein